MGNSTKDKTYRESLDKAFRETADYLYKIEGDVTPELAQAIGTLRQLINEEFKPEKSLSSQFIYDTLKKAIQEHIEGKVLGGRIDELEKVSYLGGTLADKNQEIEDRIKQLKDVEGK